MLDSFILLNAVFKSLGQLVKDGQMMTGDPIFCKSCGAVFSAISSLKGGEWKCEFCSTSNSIKLEEDEVSLRLCLPSLCVFSVCLVCVSVCVCVCVCVWMGEI
jgi:hypothetical protein